MFIFENNIEQMKLFYFLNYKLTFFYKFIKNKPNKHIIIII